MSELNLSLKHHRTLDEARARLEESVRQAQAQFGAMIQRVEWSSDRNHVHLAGTGFTARVWVDPSHVHAVVDVPILASLLGAPVVAGLKGLLENNFQKRLPG